MNKGTALSQHNVTPGQADADTVNAVAWQAPNGVIRENKRDHLSIGFAETSLRPLVYGDEPQQPRVIPLDWEQRIFDAMDKAFATTDQKGKHADGALVYDDTQVGVEFAIQKLKEMLNEQVP